MAVKPCWDDARIVDHHQLIAMKQSSQLGKHMVSESPRAAVQGHHPRGIALAQGALRYRLKGKLIIEVREEMHH
jgi:hypothetical protein